jgi:hypothetical protein
MSFAFLAAPVNNNGNNILMSSDQPDDTPISKKRASLKVEDEKSSRMANALKKIHNKFTDGDEDEDESDNSVYNPNFRNEESNRGISFNPPPPPNSIGANNSQFRESSQMVEEPFQLIGENIQKLNIPPINKINNTFSDETTVGQDGDERRHPTDSETAKYHSAPSRSGNISGSGSGMPTDETMKKLNYLIRLMEEQQHEKTNNVSEEVVLYSFLGVFVIFIVDSFNQVGKYTR